MFYKPETNFITRESIDVTDTASCDILPSVCADRYFLIGQQTGSLENSRYQTRTRFLAKVRSQDPCYIRQRYLFSLASPSFTNPRFLSPLTPTPPPLPHSPLPPISPIPPLEQCQHKPPCGRAYNKWKRSALTAGGVGE